MYNTMWHQKGGDIKVFVEKQILVSSLFWLGRNIFCKLSIIGDSFMQFF